MSTTPTSPLSLEQAWTAYDKGHLDTASNLCRELIEQNPHQGGTWHLFSRIAMQSQHMDKALELARRAILEEPTEPSHYVQLGKCLRLLNDIDGSLQNFYYALSLDALNPESLHALGETYFELGKLLDAQYCFEAYDALKPNDSKVLNQLGCLYAIQKDLTKGQEYLEKSLKQDPNNAHAHNNLANLYKEQKLYSQAEAHYQRAIDLDPLYPDPHNNLGICYLMQNQLENSFESFNRAIEKDSGFIEAYSNLGHYHLLTKNVKKAQINLEKSLSLNPNHLGSLFFMAELFRQCNDFEAALHYCEKLIALHPNNAEAQSMAGQLNISLGAYTQALHYFNQSLALNPINAKIQATRIFLAKKLYDWENLNKYQEDLKSTLELTWQANQLCDIPPFSTLALNFEPLLQLRISTEASLAYSQSLDALPFVHSPKAKNLKSRIGYLSSDFNDQPVGLLIRNLFGYHDKDKFEIFVYHTGKKDYLTEIIQENSEHFIDLQRSSDYDSAKKIYEDRIDILIDLDGYTGNGRPGILALKPAPIQAHMMSYPASLGADYIDYYITTHDMVTADNRQYFREKLVYLPKAVFATSPLIVNHSKSKQDFGIPEDKFVYCCFSQPYRIDPTLFKAWMTILGQTSNSVLWLRSSSTEIDAHFLTYVDAAGIERERIFFMKEDTLTQNWPMRLADLWLDTLSISSGTATFLCLLAGLPLLSLRGDLPQQKLASSLIKTHHVPNLIVNSLDEYINKAIHYYNKPQDLKEIQQTILNNNASSYLFKPKDFIKDLETAYTAMTTAFYQQRATDDIIIKPSN